MNYLEVIERRKMGRKIDAMRLASEFRLFGEYLTRQDCLDEICQAPTVYPWTRCKDHMPDKTGYYLCCIKQTMRNGRSRIVYEVLEYQDWNKDFFYPAPLFVDRYEIGAWQEIERYRWR